MEENYIKKSVSIFISFKWNWKNITAKFIGQSHLGLKKLQTLHTYTYFSGYVIVLMFVTHVLVLINNFLCIIFPRSVLQKNETGGSAKKK